MSFNFNILMILVSHQKLNQKLIGNLMDIYAKREADMLWYLYRSQKLNKDNIDKALKINREIGRVVIQQKLTSEQIDKLLFDLGLAYNLDFVIKHQQLTSEQVYKAIPLAQEESLKNMINSDNVKIKTIYKDKAYEELQKRKVINGF